MLGPGGSPIACDVIAAVKLRRPALKGTDRIPVAFRRGLRTVSPLVTGGAVIGGLPAARAEDGSRKGSWTLAIGYMRRIPRTVPGRCPISAWPLASA
jgi:hypothetical protein